MATFIWFVLSLARPRLSGLRVVCLVLVSAVMGCASETGPVKSHIDDAQSPTLLRLAGPPTMDDQRSDELDILIREMIQRRRQQRLERMKYKGAPWIIYYLPSRRIWWGMQIFESA